jgi:hypothetical protein
MILPFLHAFVIDTESCKGEQYALLQTAINEAFEMAADALTALEQEPMDYNVQRLVNLLFGANADMTQARETFGGLNNVRERKYDPVIRRVDEIVRDPSSCDL